MFYLFKYLIPNETMKIYQIPVAAMRTLSSPTTIKNANHTETTSVFSAELPSPTSLWTPGAATTEDNLFQKTCSAISPRLNAQGLS